MKNKDHVLRNLKEKEKESCRKLNELMDNAGKPQNPTPLEFLIWALSNTTEQEQLLICKKVDEVISQGNTDQSSSYKFAVPFNSDIHIER